MKLLLRLEIVLDLRNLVQNIIDIPSGADGASRCTPTYPYFQTHSAGTHGKHFETQPLVKFKREVGEQAVARAPAWVA